MIRLYGNPPTFLKRIHTHTMQKAVENEKNERVMRIRYERLEWRFDVCVCVF